MRVDFGISHILFRDFKLQLQYKARGMQNTQAKSVFFLGAALNEIYTLNC